MMISTQRFTSLAFSYYDGLKSDDQMSEDQKNQCVKSLPTVLEYVSYIFNYQGILVGPLSYYRDYMDFITGENILKHKRKLNKDNGDNNQLDENQPIEQPSIRVRQQT